jgi:hypothetical protein
VLLRYRLGLCTACAVAAVDLVVKALVATPADDFHSRSTTFAAASVAVVVVALGLCVLPSRLLAAGAGLVAGGAGGNLVSAAAHGGRIPNPITLGHVAFTVADAALLVGAFASTVALARVAIVHRALIDRHIPPRRWERGLRRRLGI